jgi:nicotinate-nucleotide pyrophosphorylase (carboxylating)
MLLPIDRRRAGQIVDRALEEDLGYGDLTSNAIFQKEAPIEAIIVAKEEGLLAGLPVAEMVFQKLDAKLGWTPKKQDGEKIVAGDVVAELEADVRAVLGGERVALNFLQRLSGIATGAARFAAAVRDLPVKVLDTRKTAPGLRVLDKYAVRVGGAWNHRLGLYDGVLIKDNHIRASGGIQRAVSSARQCVPPGMKIEVEASDLREVEEALNAKADIILLDNMPLQEVAEAVRLIAGRALVEASGGVTLENVREVALTGVDFISVGALTHSVKALDLSLEVS